MRTQGRRTAELAGQLRRAGLTQESPVHGHHLLSLRQHTVNVPGGPAYRQVLILLHLASGHQHR
ncbi:hypothetical protein, partial [Enterobacter cloacae complex sp. ESBL7]|uniref:hypothetical protein n=1 Tax=Enterobacter cloacae complex sp. ESBL7 TaxID=3163325 RepID=UPI0035673AE2